MKKDSIVTFGEIVWDQFPDGSVLGGAPLNVSYHLHRQEWPVLLISRVGSDPLGDQTLNNIRNIGLDTRGIQQDPELPTGTVAITFSGNVHSFEIATPAAWDSVNRQEMQAALGDDPFHLVFGTLSQRHRISRESLRALWERADTIFYDINLRQPYTPFNLVWESLEVSDVVKVNGDELLELGKELGYPGEPTAIAERIHEKFSLSLLAVTEGPDGAWLYHRSGVSRHPGFSVQVVDTVGSGDAFFSRLITGYLNEESLDKCLENANRYGSFIASKKGAMPPYSILEVEPEV